MTDASTERQPSHPDAIANRIRSRRLAMGATLDALARSAAAALPAGASRPTRRARSVSASYVCLIEQGRKVPDEPIAAALAEALGDDPRLYRAWVRLRKRADLDSVLEAAETLQRLLAEPEVGPAGGGVARGLAPGARDALSDAPGTPGSLARIRLPLIREGADPGEGVRPSCQVLDWVRWDPSGLAPELRDRVTRPVAWETSALGIRRVPSLFSPGARVVLLRDFQPLRADRAYAIRLRDGVVLSRALWNRRQLLLLPPDDGSDFELLEAGDEASLRARVLGLAVSLPPESVQAAS